MFNHGLNFPESNTTYAPPPLLTVEWMLITSCRWTIYLEYSQDTGEQGLPGILPGYWRTRLTRNTPKILGNKVYLEYSQDTGEQGLPGILPGYWRTRLTRNTPRILENKVYLEYSQYTGEQGLPGIDSQDTGEQFTWNTPIILENKVNPKYFQDTGEQGLPGILPGYWRTRLTKAGNFRMADIMINA